MSKSSSTPTIVRRDQRWPEMPPNNNMVGMPADPRPSGRERNRPANGPPIDDWEAALIGRTLIKNNAAYTRGENAEGPLSVASVAGVLMFCIQHTEGALSRVPFEVVEQIERILHDTTFKRADLPANTRYFPGGMNARSIIGRLNVWTEKRVVTRVYYG